MSIVKCEYDPKGMPFRCLGPSGLRVPLFSLGGCAQTLSIVAHVSSSASQG